MTQRSWRLVAEGFSPHNTEVETKIDDHLGSRNEATLVRRGRMWWTPDGKMYVYYAMAMASSSLGRLLSEPAKPEPAQTNAAPDPLPPMSRQVRRQLERRVAKSMRHLG